MKKWLSKDEYRAKITGEVEEITHMAEEKLKELYDSDKYLEYLKVMSRFPHYSFGNQMMIYVQNPEASMCCGYHTWKNQFGRQVIPEQYGSPILIRAPIVLGRRKKTAEIDPDAEERTEIRFRTVRIYDVRQTRGKPLPSIVSSLSGSVEYYEELKQAIEDSAPCPVIYEKMKSNMDGYYSRTDKTIHISDSLSGKQEILALLHESVHAQLHDFDVSTHEEALRGMKELGKTKQEMETEAEGTAFVCAAHFGIDTKPNSIGYLAMNSNAGDLTELKKCLDTIQKCSSMMIEKIDDRLEELVYRKELAEDLAAEPEVLGALEPMQEHGCYRLEDRIIRARDIGEGIETRIYDSHMNLLVQGLCSDPNKGVSDVVVDAEKYLRAIAENPESAVGTEDEIAVSERITGSSRMIAVSDQKLDDRLTALEMKMGDEDREAVRKLEYQKMREAQKAPKRGGKKYERKKLCI